MKQYCLLLFILEFDKRLHEEQQKSTSVIVDLRSLEKHR